MSTPVYKSICNLLAERGIAFKAVSHEPTFTSEQSAKARGEDIRVGGKALLIKTGDVFRLFVLSAAAKLDSSSLKSRFGAKKIRFATAEELKELTGLVPGAVPPFGAPILPFELFIDPTITTNERIAFNAGSLTDSIVMATKDYLSVAGGTIFAFSENAP